MQKTTIEYLTHTWNPVKMKCTKCSPGCENCWHLEQAEMRKNNPKLPQRLRDVYRSIGKSYLDLKELICSMPKKPSRIGVQFMGDLFHDAVPFEWIDRVLAMIALNPKHTFIILTKRPERMLEYFSDKDRWIFIEGRAQKLYHRKTGEDPSEWLSVKLPLPNLLPMTTICNQEEADRNIPFLLKTPAAMHGVSVEPMLGEISFGNSFYSHLMLLDLVVCGGESGAGARILNPDWVISLRDQCVEENTDFFFKQWGEYEYDKISQSGYIYDPKLRKNRPVNADDLIIGDYVARKVGKKKSGNRLHGEVWQQFPEVKG